MILDLSSLPGSKSKIIARSAARAADTSHQAGLSWCGLERLAGVTDHMTPDEFRKYGHQAVEWIAAYYERLESFPVLSTVKPGEIRAALPADPPEHGEGFDAVLRDLDAILLPGITHWQHPSFFAYFPANASGPGILGDLLASGLGVQGMIWATSPAATELETHVLDWLAALLDLPSRFRSDGPGAGVIQHSASDAALVALLAAIHRATGGRTARTGVGTERLTVYTSSQTHSSVEKACRVAGLGTDALRTIDIDPATWAARPDHLRHADRGRPGRGLHAGARRRICRHHWCRGDRPGGGAGSDRAQLRRVAACRCRLGRCCGGLPRAALAQ